MLDSAVTLLARDGWGAFSLTETARAMGTSIRPVRNRAADRGELAARTWDERLRIPLLAALENLDDAVRQRDASSIAKALARFTPRGLDCSAIAEVLVVTRYEPAVATAVDESLGEFLRARLSARPSAQDAARRSFALQAALGLLLAARFPQNRRPLTPALEELGHALCAHHPPAALPDRPAPHMDEWPTLAPGDPTLEAILRATLQLVSEQGYEGTTVRQVAKAGGVTEGFVFARYATKQELLEDALRRQHEAGWRLNAEYVDALTRDVGPGIAAAVLLREVQRPQRSLGRDMALELLRMSWHDRRLLRRAAAARDAADPSRGIDPRFTLDESRELGSYLLPRFVPDAWRLPADVVTVPLHRLRG